MATISLKINDSVLGDTEKILALTDKSRNGYINEAIEHYNKLQQRLILEKKLKQESNLVRKDSMAVLKDFEKIDHGD